MQTLDGVVTPIKFLDIGLSLKKEKVDINRKEVNFFNSEISKIRISGSGNVKEWQISLTNQFKDHTTSLYKESKEIEQFFRDFYSWLKEFHLKLGAPIEPEDQLTESLFSIEKNSKKIIRSLERTRTLAKERINDTDVYKSIDRILFIFQSLHDLLIDIRWFILEHNADLEEPEGKVYDNVEDLFSDLRKN